MRSPLADAYFENVYFYVVLVPADEMRGHEMFCSCDGREERGNQGKKVFCDNNVVVMRAVLIGLGYTIRRIITRLMGGGQRYFRVRIPQKCLLRFGKKLFCGTIQGCSLPTMGT